MRPRKLTPDALERIRRWARTLAGLPSVKAMAVELNCSTRTVQVALREAYIAERQSATCAETPVNAHYEVSRETNSGSVGAHECDGTPDNLHPGDCNSDLR